MLEYKKPDYVKEIVIQTELYKACKDSNLVCDLEYIAFSSKEEKQCVLDLVVVENYQIIAIVEVKDQKDSISVVENSEQLKRYKQFGVPIFILYSIYDIPHLVKKLVTIRDNYLKLITETKREHSKNEKKSENRWEEKVNKAIDEFNKAFPNYRFTNEYSMETVAIAVKILGLEQVIQIIDASCEKGVEDFFFQLNVLIDHYLQKSEMPILNKRTRIDNALGFGSLGRLQTTLDYERKLALIDAKLN